MKRKREPSARPFRRDHLKQFDRRLLVALHNNSEEYSVNDEVPISDATSIREPSNPHAFYLCTDPNDFMLLAQSSYNVVLQQKKPETDDGSLSRLAAARNVRYVNLEVRMGNSDRQMEMLRWLDWMLPERSAAPAAAATAGAQRTTT